MQPPPKYKEPQIIEERKVRFTSSDEEANSMEVNDGARAINVSDIAAEI